MEAYCNYEKKNYLVGRDGRVTDVYVQRVQRMVYLKTKFNGEKCIQLTIKIITTSNISVMCIFKKVFNLKMKEKNISVQLDCANMPPLI